MRTKIGVCVDHRKAIIVAVTDKGGKMHLIIQKSPKENLNTLYGAVMPFIRDEESILLFGSDDTNSEFKKYLETNHLGDHIVGMITVDTITETQMVERIRQHF
jgi:hypothetical protein